mgnify:CR=1 FL=1
MGLGQQGLWGQAGPDRAPRPEPPGSPGQPLELQTFPNHRLGAAATPGLHSLGCGRGLPLRWGGRAPTAHQRSRSNKHPTHMVIHTYTDKQTQMNGPGQGPECWEWKWGNVGEGLQEVAVTEEVGRRSRVRAFRFPRAQARFLLYAPPPGGVDRAPNDAGTGHDHRKSNENQWFFII